MPSKKVDTPMMLPFDELIRCGPAGALNGVPTENVPSAGDGLMPRLMSGLPERVRAPLLNALAGTTPFAPRRW